MPSRKRYGIVLLALSISACGRLSGSSAPPQIQLNPQLNTVDVIGLSADNLAALSRASLSDADWQSLLRVSVKSGPAGTAHTTVRPAVAGRYAVASNVLRFTPAFPLDEGRQYDVALDPSKLPGTSADESWRKEKLVAVVGRPAVVREPSTVVSHVHPSADLLPANQLRMYLYFSAPMDWRSGIDHVVLLDEDGKAVEDAFLPLDADFWNDDRTRYTLFFDPGRVKRGVLPNRQLGRALEAGKRYTLVVKREWRDGHGLPLKDEFRREFRAAAPIEGALTTAEWKVETPSAGTRDALSIAFPAPLDHGLLRRALSVARGGAALPGDIAIEGAETRWRFTPRDPWAAGEHQLVALSFLEDLAGNRIGRAFEVDNFERTDVTAEPERTTLIFRIK